MKKKAVALAAAATLSAVIAIPAFAEDTTGYGTGAHSPVPTATATPGAGMLNTGATASPHVSPFHTYSGTTGVGNYGAYDGINIDGIHTGKTTGTYRAKAYNALADGTTRSNWGWLGLLGLLGLAGLRGKSRDDDRSAIK